MEDTDKLCTLYAARAVNHAGSMICKAFLQDYYLYAQQASYFSQLDITVL